MPEISHSLSLTHSMYVWMDARDARSLVLECISMAVSAPRWVIQGLAHRDSSVRSNRVYHRFRKNEPTFATSQTFEHLLHQHK